MVVGDEGEESRNLTGVGRRWKKRMRGMSGQRETRERIRGGSERSCGLHRRHAARDEATGTSLGRSAGRKSSPYTIHREKKVKQE